MNPFLATPLNAGGAPFARCNRFLRRRFSKTSAIAENILLPPRLEGDEGRGQQLESAIGFARGRIELLRDSN